MRSTGKYSQTTKCHFYENFRFCETKNHRRKIVVIPLMHKIFQYHRFLETQKGSPKNFFGTKRQKKQEKRDTPVKYKFFDTTNFQKHQQSPLTKFFLDTKRFRQLFVISHSMVHQKNQRPTDGQHQQLSEMQKWPLTNFSVL